jgi:TDG/mug DNA glycosylase family protein
VLLFARLRLVVRDPQGSVPDILDRDLRVVFCGINPGRVSAAAGAHFANPRNDFWRLLHAGGFTSRTYDPQEQHDLLAEGIGITNAALRTTRGSGDLRRSDFAGAAARLERIASDLRPLWIAFVGKEAYRGVFGERAAFGVQERTLARTGLFVLPSTSPANAAVPWNERLRWFRELAELSKPVSRPAVRAVVLDRDDRALLFRYSNDRDPGVWVCPGGALEPGETERHALGRELEEENASDRRRRRPVDLDPVSESAKDSQHLTAINPSRFSHAGHSHLRRCVGQGVRAGHACGCFRKPRL